MGEQARGYSWPQFEAGHEQSMRHGANSVRRVQPIADELAAEIARVAPWCALPTFAAVVAAWAHAEAQAALLRTWADERGLLDEDGRPLPALAQLERVEGRAARLRAELGLTPNSWAKLLARLGSADSAAAARGLETLAAVGRELAEATARALPAPEVSDGGE